MADLKMKQRELLFLLLIVYYCNQVKCQVTMQVTAVIFCSAKATGLYPDVSTNCNQYFYCTSDNLMSRIVHCGDGKKFDGVKCSCVPEVEASPCLFGFQKAPCQVSPSKLILPTKSVVFISETTTTPLPDLSRNSSAKAFCEQKKKRGLYADVKNGCRTYFICRLGLNGMPDEVQSCSEFEVFDQHSCKCTSLNVTNCKDQTGLDPCFPSGQGPSKVPIDPPDPSTMKLASTTTAVFPGSEPFRTVTGATALPTEDADCSDDLVTLYTRFLYALLEEDF